MSQKLKIALFHNLPSGGAKRHTYEQVKELFQRGYEIHEFTLSTANTDYLPLKEYTKHTIIYPLDWKPLVPVSIPGIGPYIHFYINWRNLNHLERISKQIAAEIDSNHFDLIFVKDCKFTIAPPILNYLKTPTVFYIHSQFPPEHRGNLQNNNNSRFTENNSKFKWINKDIQKKHLNMMLGNFHNNLRKATLVITNSYFSRELLLYSRGVNSQVVYPGVDIQIFTHQKSLAGDANYILSVCSLTQLNAHWFIIKAIGKLHVNLRPKLIIATTRLDPLQEARILQHGHLHGVEVEIRSLYDSSELANLYLGAIALAFAPTLEPLGLVALEAMACGTPVIGLKEGGLRETVRHCENGFLVDRDEKEFAEALRVVITSLSQRSQLGSRARQYIEDYWTWPRAVDDLEKQFKTVLTMNSKGITMDE